MTSGRQADTETWSRDAMAKLGLHHAAVETACDLEATMATLVEVPVYDFLPIGRRLTGRDGVLHYYEHLMESFMPTLQGVRLIEEWISEASLIQEYEVTLDAAKGAQAHRLIGVLFASDARDGLLGGERIWGDETVLRLMLGPAWDELEPIPGYEG